jgi:hypothetical protein
VAREEKKGRKGRRGVARGLQGFFSASRASRRWRTRHLGAPRRCSLCPNEEDKVLFAKSPLTLQVSQET